MLYYIAPLSVWMLFCIWKATRKPRELTFVNYLFALPLILVVILRGDVGTDTTNYVANAQSVINWNGQGTDLPPFSAR